MQMKQRDAHLIAEAVGVAVQDGRECSKAGQNLVPLDLEHEQYRAQLAQLLLCGPGAAWLPLLPHLRQQTLDTACLRNCERKPEQ
jgi:hypothetical protein